MLTIMFSDMTSGTLAGVAEYYGEPGQKLFLHMKNHAAGIWSQLTKTYVFANECDVIAEVYNADGRTHLTMTYGGRRSGNVWHMSCYRISRNSSDAHHWCEAAVPGAVPGAKRASSVYGDDDIYQSFLKEDSKWHVIL